MAIKDSNRRQFYAPHVRKLEIRYLKDESTVVDQYSTLRDMEFPLLKSLHVVSHYNEWPIRDDFHLCVEYCVRPSLEEVHFMISDLDSKILRLLRRRCPKLKKFDFHVDVFYGTGINALTQLIDGCKSLKSVSIHSDELDRGFEDFDSSSDSEVEFVRAQHEQRLGSLLRSLAHYKGLEKFHLNMLPKYKTFSRVLRNLEQPFKDVRDLSLEAAEARSVSLLASKLNPEYLTALDIVIDSMTLTFNPLPQIGLLVNLQKLYISYKGEPLSDIFPLKNLKCLRVFEISDSPMGEFTDEMFISVLENWPELEVLILEGQNSKLSTTFLTSLGKLCPRLEDCSIQGEYDLNDWQNIPRPIFSQLQYLRITNLVDREEESQ